MNSEFVVLTDKNNKPKKCVVNDKNKVLYVKKNNNDVKYVKHNNKFILKNEYVKLCKKKTKKMRGGNDKEHIAHIDTETNKLIIVKKSDGLNIDRKDYYIITYKNVENTDSILYYQIDGNPEGEPVNKNEILNIWTHAIIANLTDLSIELLANTINSDTKLIFNAVFNTMYLEDTHSKSSLTKLYSETIKKNVEATRIAEIFEREDILTDSLIKNLQEEIEKTKSSISSSLFKDDNISVSLDRLKETLKREDKEEIKKNILALQNALSLNETSLLNENPHERQERLKNIALIRSNILSLIKGNQLV